MNAKLKDTIIVFIVFVLGAIAISNYLSPLAQRIEQKLQNTIHYTLQSHDLDWVEVSVDGRDVTLEGMAATRQKYNQALKLVQNTPGIRQLDNQIQVQIRRVTPYSLTAEYQDQKLQLAGYMPDQASQEAIQVHLNTHFSEQNIQNDLETASGEPANWQQAMHTALENLPQLQRARLEVINYDVRLTGIVETEEHLLQVKQNFNALKDYHYQPFVYLQVATEKPPVKSPYIFNAEYQHNQLSIEGYVPDTMSQQMIEENLSFFFNQKSIKNNLLLASGQPADWQELLLLLLESMSQFQNARLEVTNYNVLLSGTLPTTARLKLVKEKLTSFKNKYYRLNLYLKAADEKAPPKRVDPYTFYADYENQELRTRGYFPTQEVRREFIKQARNVFSGEKFIDDGLRIASGEPAHWQSVINQLLKNLKKLQRGRLEISNYNIRLTGLVNTTKTKESLKELIPQLLKHHYHLQLYVQAADTQSLVCQRKFNVLLGSKAIGFAPNSARIQIKSYSLLERLITVAKSCPEAKITIAGHTDALGDAEKNQQLSQQRAEAVRTYLIKNGIEEQLIKAIGYGEAKPIASNDTAASRAKNRRIEFLIEGY